MIALLGMVVMLLIAWSLSSNRRVIPWRTVLTGTALQFSGYGGKTREAGTANRQRFPLEPGSLSQVPSAAGSSWVLEIQPRERVSYALLAPSGETRFRVDFDLKRRTSRPHSPWGFTRVRGGTRDSASVRSP